MLKMREAVKGFLATITYCLKLSWHSSRRFTMIRLVGRLVPPVVGIVSSFIYKNIIDVLTGAKNVPNAQQDVLGLVFMATMFAISTGVVQKLVSYAEGLHKQILECYISTNMMEKAEKANLSFFDDSTAYDKFTTVKQDSYALTYILWSTLDGVSSFVGFLGAAVVLCTSNWLYAVLMTLAAFPSAIANRKYTKSLYKLSLSQANDERKKDYLFHISTTKQYAQDLRLYNIGGLLRERYQRLWDTIFHAQKTKIKKRTVITVICDLLPEIVIGFITLNIAFSVLSRNATLGDYTLYTRLLGQLLTTVFAFSTAAINIYENKLKIDNVKSFDKTSNVFHETGNIKLEEIQKIELVNVSFTYPGNKSPSLSDVSFTILKGERICLVGVNGSGKTTLIKLLMRFYDATEGEIRINDRDIRDYAVTSLRRCFSCYFQSSPNYGFSIKENVSISDFDAAVREEKILDALHNGAAEDMADLKPNGLDSCLTRAFDNNGVELSGGQNQKIALSRTFYRECSILVLDEPSSSLDPEAEDKILNNLYEFSCGKMVLFTSHRLTNASIADKIIVLEKGRIIESGSKAELLKNPGRFAELYEFQANKFV